MLMQGRSKVQYVLVIVLSDVLFFLQDNNSKYSFFTPDNKVRLKLFFVIQQELLQIISF